MVPPAATPDEAPAWPSDMWVSPSKLKAYAECPRSVRLQYVDRIRSRQPMSAAFEEGKVAHKMLADAARRIQQGVALRSTDELETWVQRSLPVNTYPSDAAREATRRKILRWVEFGVSRIDRTARILRVEKNEQRSFPLAGFTSRFTIATRPDLVLLHEQSRPEPFVEILDFKTGSVYVDAISPVAMRFALKPLLRTLVGDTTSLLLRYTFVFLDHGQTEQVLLTPEYLDTAWSDVLALTGRMVGDREWKPTPSHRCHWCPYNGNPCMAFAEHINSSPLDD